MARPTKSEADLRSESIKIWVSKAELDKIRERAGLIPISSFIRSMIGIEPIKSTIPEINARAYADLSRLGNNLNQLQHRLNSNNDSAPRVLIERMLPVIVETRGLLHQVSRQLFGEGK